MSFIAIGYADWPLIALHFSTRQIVRPSLIPSLYVGGMGAEAVASLILGRLFDRFGLNIVIGVTILTAAYGPLVFLGGDCPVGHILKPAGDTTSAAGSLTLNPCPHSLCICCVELSR